MATDENNGRIPTKKRGRPRKEKTRASTAKKAKERLNIVSVKKPEGWIWSLPARDNEEGE